MCVCELVISIRAPMQNINQYNSHGVLSVHLKKEIEWKFGNEATVIASTRHVLVVDKCGVQLFYCQKHTSVAVALVVVVVVDLLGKNEAEKARACNFQSGKCYLLF